jgi:hypothetical protein
MMSLDDKRRKLWYFCGLGQSLVVGSRSLGSSWNLERSGACTLRLRRGTPSPGVEHTRVAGAQSRPGLGFGVEGIQNSGRNITRILPSLQTETNDEKLSLLTFSPQGSWSGAGAPGLLLLGQTKPPRVSLTACEPQFTANGYSSTPKSPKTNHIPEDGRHRTGYIRMQFSLARGPLDPLTTAILDQPPGRKRLAPHSQ